MYFVVYFVLLCMFQRAECERKLDTVRCPVRAADVCSENEICSGRCMFPCVDTPQYYVWGSQMYTYDSSICKAATHDRRISTWDTSKRNFVFKRTSQYYKNFMASVRFGIETKNYGELWNHADGSFIFLNPRIHEEILDVASVHQAFIFGSEKEHVQGCYGANTAASRKFTFKTFPPGETPSHLDPQYSNLGDTVNYTMTWSKMNEKSESGGFQCIPEKSMLSIITSVAMSSDAVFLPSRVTYTANINDSVTLVMTEHSETSACRILWKKDGETIPTYIISDRTQKETSLVLSSVQEGSQGVYSLECTSQTSRRGVVRLIVRVCPKNKYGDECKQQCPECENGGICHDITGVCICPPGFNGTHCELACPHGHFGQTCTIPCPMVREDQSCHELLICLPDPYGCSCGAGYKGILCNQECDPGEFGAGCYQKRECHCIDGEPCDKYTGLCQSDCIDGWHGVGCSVSYPVLTRSPLLLKATKSTISLSIPEWDREVDFGDGTPSSYRVYYMEKSPGKTWNEFENPDKTKTNQNITLDNLKPAMVYLIKVEIIDITGNSQRNNLNAAEYSTLCDQPLEPPTDITVTPEKDKVSITWELPDRRFWNCKTVETIVKYQSYDSYDEKLVLEQQYSFRSKPFTEWNVTMCLRPGNSTPDDTTCAPALDVRTKEDAPGRVNEISYTRESPRSLRLIWKNPPEKNGVIRYFVLHYEQSGWRHSCPEFFNTSSSVLNINSTDVTVPGLNPSSTYTVSLTAVTVKEGPPHTITCYTIEDVPSAGPTDLKLLSERTLTWNPPPCNVSNGNITGYRITVKGLSPWNMEEVTKVETKGKRIDLSLIPYTKYDVKAFARTTAGFGINYSQKIFTTKAKEPLAPRNITIYSRNMHSLSLAWLPPYPPYGQLSKYIIRSGIQGSAQGRREVSVLVSVTQCKEESLKDFHCYTLSNLDKSKIYEIQIYAVNEGIESKGETAKIAGETSESVPELPQSSEVSGRNATFITISWKEPRISNGELQNYRLNISVLESSSSPLPSGQGQSETKTLTVAASTKQYTFKDLRPATNYSLTIEASTRVGYGPPLAVLVGTNISVPVVDREAQFLSKTKDSIKIRIFPVKPLGGPISAYFVVVKESSSNGRSKRHAPNFFESKKCRVQLFNDQYVAGRLKYVPPGGINYTVGDGRCVDEYYNQRLIPDTYYQIGIAVLSQYGDETKYSAIKYIAQAILVETPTEVDVYGIILGILIFLIIVVITLIVIFLKFPHLITLAREKASKSLKLIPFRERRQIPVSYTNATVEDDDDIIETESITEDLSCKIPVDELEDYILENIKNGEIKKQYRDLPRGQKYACHESKIPANRMKNRYGNLLPYDHSRVKLKLLPDDTHSDYINANYVSGYRKEKKYIATQGPMPKTANDFWRMVWEQKSCKILMATNLVEGGKIKCEKYWPDESCTYGSITVTLKHSQQFSDYVIRKFDISKDNEKREIKQFHFLTWPDHGVPMCTSPVVRFLKKARDYQPNDKAPIVIHCSAGVGRTGTLILLDSMLNMGEAENQVDLSGHLSLMRQQRSNIVENLDQYIFVYKSLVQSLCWRETSVLCADLIPQIGNLRTSDPRTYFTPLEMEYQRLSKICPKLDNVSVRVAREPTNVSKNRTMEILPPERARPLLKLGEGATEVYINAVYVNGYKEKDAFVATQHPLPDTIPDFWQMIRDIKSQTIVLLQQIDFTNPTCPQYWPSEGQVVTFDEFQVQCNSLEVEGDINVWSLTILNSKDDSDASPLPIKLFHHLNWGALRDLPQHPNSILNMMAKVEKVQHQYGKHIVTVQCLNGSTACGIFCATMLVCNKMINEQEVDVFGAVQNIRANRPEFIENYEQYDFLYDMAIAFLDNFGAYANFL